MPATSLSRSLSRYVPYAHDHLGCFDSLDLLTASGSVAEYAALDLPATRYILQITPVVTVRPTMFLESFPPLAGPTVRDRGRIELPFGRGKTSPVAAADVARVVAAVLADPRPHLGRLYELTGPRSQDMHGVAREYSDALNREVTYADIPPQKLGTGAEEGGIAGAPDPAS